MRAYHQMLMHPGDALKTKFITPFELFDSIHMPFGLLNVSQISHKLIVGIIQVLYFAFASWITSLLLARTQMNTDDDVVV